MTQPLITGSWIDVVHLNGREGVYWNRMTLDYCDEDWARLLHHLRVDLGIELLILQNLVADKLAVYPSRIYRQQWPTRNCADPVGAMLRAASREKIQMYIGVGAAPSGLAEQAAELRDVSCELLERYGDEPSFVGWYMTTEMYFQHGVLMREQVDRCVALTEVWAQLTPHKPRLASPFFLGGECRVASPQQLADDLRRSGLSIVAYQDGVGCGSGRSQPIPPQNNEPLYRALRQAHEQTNVALWANVESFEFENRIWGRPLIPAPFERLRQQMQHAAPHVERIVSYTVPGIMTSQQLFPRLGEPQTEPLYQAYRRYLADMKRPQTTEVG